MPSFRWSFGNHILVLRIQDGLYLRVTVLEGWQQDWP